MKRPKSSRLRKVVPTTALFLVLALNGLEEGVTSTPTTPPPSPEELAVLEELNDWVGGEYPDHFRAVGRTDLADAVRTRQRSFELFRTYNDETARLGRLAEIPYGRMIRRVAARHELDALLVAAIIEAESGFDPRAVSPVGAQGLMQLMPSTPGYFQVEDASDPWINVELGSRYLSRLLREFDGDLVLALAAYNAGPAAVSRFNGIPPYRETRRYVSRVLALYVDHHKAIWESTGAGHWLFETEDDVQVVQVASAS